MSGIRNAAPMDTCAVKTPEQQAAFAMTTPELLDVQGQFHRAMRYDEVFTEREFALYCAVNTEIVRRSPVCDDDWSFLDADEEDRSLDSFGDEAREARS